MRTEEKPFIHMMRTPLCNYLYDVNTNLFVGLDENTYKHLKKVEQGECSLEDSDDGHVIRNIAILKEQGFLSTKHPKEIRHGHSDLMEWHLSENIRQIALQVTQQCNFRCAYCAYCAGDFELQRDHSAKRMSIETALTAVDFYASRCGNQEHPAIAFYGGEPLLEFPLIQKVVEYAEKKLYGKKLIFTITTNASLLTVDFARFFSEHNFITTISLDGTPETHDKSRRFASDGGGSFAVIQDNLKNIVENCPEFKFSFNIVIDPRYPCDSMHQLFSSKSFFRKARITSTLINDQFSIEKTVPGDIFLHQNYCYMFQSYLTLLGLYDRKNISRVALTELISSLKKIKDSMRPSISIPDAAAPGGPCIAGAMRLFVNVDGNLFPCERVSEKSEAMNIGNLWEGFDYNKINKLINIAQTTEEKCKNCWAFQHCTLCCTHSDNCGELSADLRLSQCNRIHAQVEDTFRDYLWMREFDVSYDIINQEG